MTKSELRRMYLEKRLRLSVTEAALMSAAIAERFFAETDLSKVRSIHTFIRIRKFAEVDTSMIYYRLWRDHSAIKTFAPVTDIATGEIDCRPFGPRMELIENDWGIREPFGTERADPGEIDLVIVPLLCFDLAGHRVGYGKGFYDRFLARCRPDCIKVGLSYFPPESAIDDIGVADVPLDACVTPDRLFRP